MGKKTTREFDSHSTMSSASKGSDKKKRHRFSLRHIFAGSRSKSVKSHSSLEFETRSELSMNTYPDRDFRTPSVKSVETINTLNASIGSTYECPLCLSVQPIESFPLIMTCLHRSCLDCLRQYLRIEITESRVNISCPECSEQYHPNDIKAILNNPQLMDKYEEFMLRRVLVLDSDTRWCPAPDCGYAVIATGCAGCPKIHCERPGCDAYFCYHCKQQWHPNQTCDNANAKRLHNLLSLSIADTLSHKDDIKPCPRCSAFIVKMDDGSCNHMTCAVCGAEFCWLCMKEISDLHYLSPSGCTFWGKKPWSRKKKILWQLATLVGAPVAISLVAGIAVPAIIIGVPVWVGRKLHGKYNQGSVHKRNLIITGGVVCSVLLSPLLAGLAVGIGVPILLAYIYGVVPLSLFRTGVCGVRTSNSGVRLEFEDDNDVAVNPSVAYSGDNRSTDTASHMNVGNPSIAPSIGEASMGMTNSLSASGSHMDRAGIIRDDESDRQSASHRAIGGPSLDGSLNGSVVIGPNGFQNRLEVHADVASTSHLQKRASFSSDSANLSLGDKTSVTYSHLGDDVSTRGLAGSIGGGRDKDSFTIPSLEIQDETSMQNEEHSDYSRTKATKESPRLVRRKDLSGQSSPPSGRSVTFFDGEVKHYKTRVDNQANLSDLTDKVHVAAKSKPRHQSLDHEDSCERIVKAKIRHQSLECRVCQDSVHGLTKSHKNPHLNTGSVSSSEAFTENGKDTFMTGSEPTLPSSGVTGLPEVESDKPLSMVVSRTISKSVPINNTLIDGPVLCNIVEERKITSNDELKIEDDMVLSHSKVRRLSCEMAIKHGRLSPNAFV